MTGPAQLSLEQAPPLHIPLRFFLTAPLFGVLAGLLVLVEGPAALPVRWNPATLALTHLLTLGVLAQVMCGALLQMLPVLAGAPVPAVGRVGRWAHALLTVGTLLLAGGLWATQPLYQQAGAILLAGAFVLVLAAMALGLRRAAHRPPVARGMAMALLALAVTVVLGTLLTLQRSGAVVLPGGLAWADVHAGWGLIGWVGGLIVVVAGEVLPMFYVTPDGPRWARRAALALLPALLLWSVARGAGSDFADSLLALLGLGLAAFAVHTIRQIRRRQRRLADVTLDYWVAGLVALLVSVALGLCGWLWPRLGDHLAFPVLVAGGYLLGFTLSVTSGMLQKIVPFLAWFHLHHRQLAGARAAQRLPSVRELLPAPAVGRQLRLYLGSLALFPPALIWPHWFARPAGLLLVAAALVLFVNVAQVARRYRTLLRTLELPA